MTTAGHNTDGEGRSQAILDATLAVFSEAGYHKARIEDIAERAGVAKGTIYLYFPSKKKLFSALIEEIGLRHLAAMKKAFKGHGTLKDQLIVIAQESLKLAKARKDFRDLNVNEVMICDPVFKKKVLIFREKCIRTIASALAESAGDNRLSRDYYRDAAIAFIGLLHAFDPELIDSSEQELDKEHLPQRIVSLFLEGLKGVSTGSKD